MATERSYARLGFFLVVSAVVVLATGLFFLQRVRDRPAIGYVTYTDENVAGLDVSSPVRFRGVPIGQIDDIRVDPRESLIEIDFQIFLDRVRQLGGDVAQIQEQALQEMLPRARTQIIGNPVTGEAYLLMDILDNPPPPRELGFTPARTYVPMIPSPLAAARDRLPAVIERAEGVLLSLGDTIRRLPGSLDRADRFFTNVERIFQESDLPQLSADARTFFDTASADLERLTTDVNQMVGAEGTLVRFVEDVQKVVDQSELPATTGAVRDSLDRTTLAADDLRRSLPAIRDALEHLRELGRLLEEQPESVLYGRRPPQEQRR